MILKKPSKGDELEAFIADQKRTKSKLRDRLKEIEGDINTLMVDLRKEPDTLTDLSELQLEGWLFVTESGKINWKKYYSRLTSDVISLFEGPTTRDVKRIYTIVFYQLFDVTEEDKLTGKQIKEGLFCKKRIRLVTPGTMLDISFESDEMGSAWNDVLSRLINMKYTQEELKEKENIQNGINPLLKYQQELLLEKFVLIVRALTDNGFWISEEKKLRDGYCYLKRVGKKSRKLYCVLYKDFLYLFKPKTTVSVDEKPYDMVNLKFITACDIENKESSFTFSITTPLRIFYLRTKHEVALQEWVDKIRVTVETKNNKRLAPLKPIKRIEDKHGYYYNKPVLKYLSVLENQKSHKLKGASTTIGRSSSNELTISGDKYISRSHCKILIEDNVPYIMDLGQSKDGTKLNGKKITKAPLKPGDKLLIGKTNIIFQVKNGTEIFEMHSGPYSPKEITSDIESVSTSGNGIELEVKLEED